MESGVCSAKNVAVHDAYTNQWKRGEYPAILQTNAALYLRGTASTALQCIDLASMTDAQ